MQHDSDNVTITPPLTARLSRGGRLVLFGEMIMEILVQAHVRLWRPWPALFALITLLASSCSTPARLNPTEPWHTVTLGLCEDYPEESRTLEHARADLAVARDAGA